MADEEQFSEYPGSLLACERAVIRRDLRVGVILGADGGPYPFPSGSGDKVYSAYGDPVIDVPLPLNVETLLAQLAFDGITLPILPTGKRAAISAVMTIEWETNPAAIPPTQFLGALHLDGADISSGQRLMWQIWQAARPDTGLAGSFGSAVLSLMGEFDGDDAPHVVKLWVVPNNGPLTAQINPSASPNIALRAHVFTP